VSAADSLELTLLSLNQADCAVDVPVPEEKNFGYTLSMRIDADVPQSPNPVPKICKIIDPVAGTLDFPIDKRSNLNEKDKILELKD